MNICCKTYNAHIPRTRILVIPRKQLNIYNTAIYTFVLIILLNLHEAEIILMVMKVSGDIVRLSKFYGLKKKEFLLHLKECEFRFNH